MNGEFGDDDIKRAKNLLINSYDFGNETNDGKASSIGFYEVLDSYRFALDYVKHVNNVTKEDHMKTARKYLSPPYCLLTVKPEPRKKKLFDDEDE